MYLALDIFFTIFHLIIVIFNVTGWIWKKTRGLHRVVMSLTLFSWLALGFFYGIGYCFLTDWHYQVLEARGYTSLPYSYITFLIERLFGSGPSDDFVIKATIVVFTPVALITYGLWLLEAWKKKWQSANPE